MQTDPWVRVVSLLLRLFQEVGREGSCTGTCFL